MEINPAKWSKSHEALAKKHLKKNGIIGSRTVNLPKLPRDPLEWIKVARLKELRIDPFLLLRFGSQYTRIRPTLSW